MARLNFRFALLVAFLVVFIGHGLVTDAKPIEKKEAEEKDAKEATTEVAPKEEEAADDAADDASEEEAPEEDASTQKKSHKQKSAAQKKCKKGINKNCGKREFRLPGALRPFSHNPGHSIDQEGNEGEDEEEKEEKEGDEEQEESPEDRGYDEDAQRNVMAQDGGPSDDLEGAFSHGANSDTSEHDKHPKHETSNIKEQDDEERIEQDIINQEAEPAQRDNKPEETLQNPSPDQKASAEGANAVEGKDETDAAPPLIDSSNAIDPAVAAAAAAKTETAAAAAHAGATTHETAAGAQQEAGTATSAETKATPSANVHDDGEMREINEGNYDHHSSNCPFEHEQIMQVAHGNSKGFLHGHGTYGHGCGCGNGCGCECGCEHGALGPSGTRIGCDCPPAGHLATYVADTKNTPACPNLNCASICGNVNLGLPHPCCQNSNAQDAYKLEAEKAYCPSCKLVNINGNVGLSLPHPCIQLSDDQKCNCATAGTCGGHCSGCGCGVCGSCGCDHICGSGRAVVAPAAAETAAAQKDNSTATASGEEPSETTEAKMQKFKDSVAKVDAEAKGESSEGETKHPEKRSDSENEEGEEDMVEDRSKVMHQEKAAQRDCCHDPCYHYHGEEEQIVGCACQGVHCHNGGDLHRALPHPDEQLNGHHYPGCTHHICGCGHVHNDLPHHVQMEMNMGCDHAHGHRCMHPCHSHCCHDCCHHGHHGHHGHGCCGCHHCCCGCHHGHHGHHGWGQ